LRKYIVRKKEEAPEVIHSSCGESLRLITGQDTPHVSFHVVHILDGKTHYHKQSTEIYHVLEGVGTLDLDQDVVDLVPGMTVLIPPGVRHRGHGDFKTVVVGTPAFSLDDEFFD